MLNYIKNCWNYMWECTSPDRVLVPSKLETGWREQIERVKYVLYSHVHPAQEFRLILVSGDIADQIHLEFYRKHEEEFCLGLDIDTLTQFDGISIKRDSLLPRGSVVFVPAEPK